jgi:uroporphyrinogen decarboxylase
MGVKTLNKFRGSITFWGEIDRQHLLPWGTSTQINKAVHLVKENLGVHRPVRVRCRRKHGQRLRCVCYVGFTRFNLMFFSFLYIIIEL